MSSYDNLDPRNTVGLAGYPSSGAYSHLPIRTTITGDAMIPHPNANKIFLRNLPSHCYRLPDVQLNFTLVEIIVLLPNWFKNRAIASRFMNNCLTANIHFEILEEHRYSNFASGQEREKAKKTITDEYRKTMRSISHNSGWTKVKHRPSLEWDPMLMSMDGFVPDDTQMEGFLQLPPIPFQVLTDGVRKLPEGNNAGDLTRAVQFALTNPDYFMFPDDLPRILDHIGRTQLTTAHTDRPVVRTYAEYLRKKAKDGRSERDRDSSPSAEERVVCKKARVAARPILSQQQTTMHAAQQHVYQSLSAIVPSPNVQAEYMPLKAAVDSSSEEMDALLRPYLTPEGLQARMLPAIPVVLYHPHHLLRECIEGNVGFDGSPLARAARFAQQPEQIAMDWYVENVSGLVQFLDNVP